MATWSTSPTRSGRSCEPDRQPNGSQVEETPIDGKPVAAASKTLPATGGRKAAPRSWPSAVFFCWRSCSSSVRRFNSASSTTTIPLYVYENPHVTQGLTVESVRWAFTGSHGGNWHPLTSLSHLLDYQLYGQHAGGHHATNVLLHAAAAILLFQVLRRMTGNLWPAAFAAAVFAIHPLRAESVAWVSERKDVLSGLFFMLTLAAYLGYVRHPFSIVRYAVLLLTFALGLMSKPMLVTLPFVLLLLDYWPLGRMAVQSRDRAGRAAGRDATVAACTVVEKIPLFLLAAASCMATMSGPEASRHHTGNSCPWSVRVSNALVACVAYVGQFFYPVGLAVYYPHLGPNLPLWEPVAAFLFLAGISIAALLGRRRFPALLVGWFWYLGMLVPVIGLVQVGTQSRADRYTYLPQIGLCIARGVVLGGAGIVFGGADIPVCKPGQPTADGMSAPPLRMRAIAAGCVRPCRRWRWRR